MAAVALSEPAVLATAKECLFADRGYVVADTQFAQDRWLADRQVDEEIREALAPFNHVKVGSGYPDLVGVSPLDNELLAVDRVGDEPPLIAVEAKGETGSGVDVERGIVQAYDRLHEANVAYTVAPADAITPANRTLASELNVGLIGVRRDGRREVYERPRVVGTHAADEATAIRFQASAQGVADRSFGLNHPKNYLAVPIALAADGDHRVLIETHVVGAVDDAIRGAEFLGLVEADRPELRRTQLGDEVVRFALRAESSLQGALEAFEGWQRSRKRFVEVAPRWGELTRRVVYEYPATKLLVANLQELHDDGTTAPSLPTVVETLHEHHPTFTVELFIRGEGPVRRRVLTDDGELRSGPLAAGGTYHAPTVFQLKAMLYHAGILTERGQEPDKLTPSEDVWQLRNPVPRWR